MSLTNQIKAAIKGIPNISGGLVTTIDVSKVVNQVYDSATGKMVSTSSTYRFKGFAEKFTEQEMSSLNVSSQDVKLILLNIDELSLTVKDSVVFLGHTYNIKSIEPQYIANSIGFFTVILTR